MHVRVHCNCVYKIASKLLDFRCVYKIASKLLDFQCDVFYNYDMI